MKKRKKGKKKPEPCSQKVALRPSGVLLVPVRFQARKSVEVVKSIPQERIPELMCEQSEVIDCHQNLKPRSKFAAHSGSHAWFDQDLKPRPELAVFTGAVSHDTRREPISRISERRRELRRVLSLFLNIEDKKERRWLQRHAWEVSDKEGGREPSGAIGTLSRAPDGQCRLSETVFEAEKFQCVDFLLSVWVERWCWIALIFLFVWQ